MTRGINDLKEGTERTYVFGFGVGIAEGQLEMNSMSRGDKRNNEEGRGVIGRAQSFLPDQ